MASRLHILVALFGLGGGGLIDFALLSQKKARQRQTLHRAQRHSHTPRRRRADSINHPCMHACIQSGKPFAPCRAATSAAAAAVAYSRGIPPCPEPGGGRGFCSGSRLIKAPPSAAMPSPVWPPYLRCLRGCLRSPAPLLACSNSNRSSPPAKQPAEREGRSLAG